MFNGLRRKKMKQVNFGSLVIAQLRVLHTIIQVISFDSGAGNL